MVAVAEGAVKWASPGADNVGMGQKFVGLLRGKISPVDNRKRFDAVQKNGFLVLDNFAVLSPRQIWYISKLKILPAAFLTKHFKWYFTFKPYDSIDCPALRKALFGYI